MLRLTFGVKQAIKLHCTFCAGNAAQRDSGVLEIMTLKDKAWYFCKLLFLGTKCQYFLNKK